jgi:hypothetical protein
VAFLAKPEKGIYHLVTVAKTRRPRVAAVVQHKEFPIVLWEHRGERHFQVLNVLIRGRTVIFKLANGWLHVA